MSISAIQAMPPGSWLSIADAIVKATLLIGAGALRALLLRRASAASRHLAWTLALASAPALPALWLALPRWQLPIVTLTGAAAPTQAIAPQPPMSHRQDRAAGIAAPDASVPASAVARASLSWPTVILAIW